MNFSGGPIRAKKQLGQHFLADLNIARNTVALLQPSPAERVFEIGPGMGVLTQLLSSTLLHPIIALDADAEAIAYLRQLQLPRVELLHGDVLSTPWPEGDLALIGNLPYNISSPIFFQLLEHRAQIRRAVVMIQLEVAQRIAEPPGSKTYGILSVLIGCYYRIRLEFKVPPTVFRPPPAVMSAVISLERRDEASQSVPFEPLKRVVKAAFGQRRKTLRNALSGLGPIPPSVSDATLSRRAETLSIAEFVALSEAYAGR
jgi:16S rRNA (adenine1518-N6/adenine1519-N6)-dimethyltransferase